ncbi:MAG: hypothetical protein HHJ09_12920 [Glaciimonas sp.]|nr:hypothetical protein [Glaciimonas sp.]
MQNFTLPIMLTLATLITGCGGGSSDGEPTSALAVIGDVPYGTGPGDNAQFLASPTFINAINSDPDASLVLHVGDIHSGKQYCTSDYDLSIYKQWTAFKSPVVYTPGDNEWTDCHKAKEGGGTYNAVTGQIVYKVDGSNNWIDYAGGDPIANLELIRSIFFASPGKTFGGAMNVHSQAQEYDIAHPSDSNYVENVWWAKSKTLFVTLNIPGGSNNDTDPWYGAPAMSPAQAREVTNRTAANLRWLDSAFKQASANGAIAVVIQTQADMWDIDGVALSHITQYKQFIDSIASHATAFGKPVLLLNGDSHVYRSDNPLVQGAPCVIEPSSGATAVACSSSNMSAGSNNPGDPYMTQPNGYNVPNFHRVVVHGSTTPLEWLKLTIDPNANAANGADSFGPFRWKRIQPKL